MHPMTHVCDRTNHSSTFLVLCLINMHQSRPYLEWIYAGHHPRKASVFCWDQGHSSALLQGHSSTPGGAPRLHFTLRLLRTGGKAHGGQEEDFMDGQAAGERPGKIYCMDSQQYSVPLWVHAVVPHRLPWKVLSTGVKRVNTNELWANAMRCPVHSPVCVRPSYWSCKIT